MTANCAGVLQGVCDVESSQSSKRVAAPRGNNDRDRVLDGVRVDVEWEHKPICGRTSGCETVRTRMFSIQAPVFLVRD